MIEIWKPYPGDLKYAVSDQGRVRRESTGRVLRPGRMGRGYLSVSVSQRRTRYVHRMVWESHVGPIPPGMEVRHGPNGREDNRLSQLKIGTPKENAADRIAHGTQARGEKHGRSAVNRRRSRGGVIPIANTRTTC